MFDYRKAIRASLLLFIPIQLLAQPTSEMIDILEGSNIKFKEIFYGERKIFITSWDIPTKHQTYTYGLSRDTSEVGGLLNMLVVKRSEMDSAFTKRVFIYDNDSMVVNIKKNRSFLKVVFNKLMFTEGVFFIDLEKIYRNNGSKRRVELELFPIEDD